jgi:hypothetical protein
MFTCLVHSKWTCNEKDLELMLKLGLFVQQWLDEQPQISFEEGIMKLPK